MSENETVVTTAGIVGADDLLERIAVAWFGSRAASREGKLRVGILTHDFILIRVRRGAGLSERSRYQQLCTRQAAVREVANKIGLKECRVNELVHVAMTVALLGGDPPPDFGRTCWNTLRQFYPLVQRRRITRGEWRQTKEGGRKAVPARVEEWHIIPGMECRGPELFRRTLAEGLGTVDTHCAVRGLLGGNMDDRRSRKPSGGWGAFPTPTVGDLVPPLVDFSPRSSHVDSFEMNLSEDSLPPLSRPGGMPPVPVALFADMCRRAGPRDLAEMLADLVAQHSDSELLSRMLIERLERLVHANLAGDDE